MKKFGTFAKSMLAASALFFGSNIARAQSYSDSLAQDDRDILSSIAPYSADVRTAILGVSQYPQALVKIERIQARSSQAFQDMVEGFSRDEQEKLYEASRFPTLIDQLTSKGKLSDDQVQPLLKDFPEATQSRLRETYASHFDELVKMNSIYNSSQDGLQKIIGSYPSDIQDDFKKVISMPDVVNLLTENINLTVSLGEEYKADPNGVRQQLDQLNVQLSDENAKDLAAYKKQVESDPKLQTEMRSAATEFSSAYDQPDNPTYVTNNYYDNYPYPYWTSYPYWYSTPIWYPRPMYYHTGFYYGPGGGLVVVGLPSPIYSNWFFGRGYRHYPLLYRNYNSYYTNYHRNFNNNRYGYHGNVYRGFNDAAHQHFNGRPGTRSTYNTRPAVGGGNNGNNNGRNTRGNTRPANSSGGQFSNPTRSTQSFNNNTRTSQMNVNPNNFNSRGIQHYQASDFHRSGWQNVSGARVGGTITRPASSFRSGGFAAPQRSSAPHMSGGGGGGASHGGRHR